MRAEVRNIKLLEEIGILVLLLRLSLDIVSTRTPLVEEHELRGACVLYREAFDIHRRGHQSCRFLVVVYLLDLFGVVYQELGCTVAFGHIDAGREDDLVDFVDFRDDGLGVLEHQHKLQKPHAIVSDHREHLALLRPNFHFLLSII